MSSLALAQPFFYTFFTIVEPTLALGGAIYAALLPRLYFKNLPIVPWQAPAPTNPHPTSIGTSHLLGNCYFLLSLISFVVLPGIARDNRIPEIAKLSILRRFFFVLAVADLTHVSWALWDLGDQVAFRLNRWNGLAFGNIAITLALFTVRMFWFWSSAKLDRSKKR